MAVLPACSGTAIEREGHRNYKFDRLARHLGRRFRQGSNRCFTQGHRLLMASKRLLPPGLERAGAVLGGGDRRTPEGLVGRRDADLPVAGRGRPRKNHVPDVTSLWAERTLADAELEARNQGAAEGSFRRGRVGVADGDRQRMGDQAMPGEEAWLIGEHRSKGERKCYLSNLPADAPLKRLAGAVKARWACEQAHRQLKEDLALDHFEGRSWHGLYKHAPMSMIACAFLQRRRLNQASGEKRTTGPPPQPNLPAIRQAILHQIVTPPPPMFLPSSLAHPVCQRSSRCIHPGRSECLLLDGD